MVNLEYDLNKAIKRQHYRLPSAEELFAEMSGAMYFTKLDASNGYWQIKVDNESSNLLTFNTIFGRYKFKRLPFGIHSASEVFQQEISDIISGISNCRNSQDDIIIWGSTIEDLDHTTKEVFKEIRKCGLKLNASKCIFRATEVKFLGHIISSDGLSPNPSKVEAIQNLSMPKSKADLQRFLGMVGYLSKFIPNLSEATSILRQLLEKGIEWNFTDIYVNSFINLKNLIASSTSLDFFDPVKQTKVTCDASQNGCYP